MKLLWLFCILPLIAAQGDFGKSYLKNSRLCHTWYCVNTKLGLPDSLPSKVVAEVAFKNTLPQGPWQDVVEKAVNTCYSNRTRQYTNTCPGQALMHCVVDHLIYNCPQEFIKPDDACSQVSSLAGFKYMFSQSRYESLEKNLPKERRPDWFLKHYFDRKCCDLPDLFNQTVLQSCGFSSFMMFHDHEPKYEYVASNTETATSSTPFSPAQNDGEAVKFVHLNPPTTTPVDVDISNTDPLDCCNMNEFIQPAWRSECGFKLTWQGQERLVIANSTPELTTTAVPLTTTTAAADAPKDLMLLPHSCAAETCVFRNLGIITESGSVNTMAFMRLLNNFTDAHPSWKKASARVVTRCLSRRVRDYEGDCEINRILACTLDLLTENCPYRRKSEDSCKRNKKMRGCQISSSRLRPKNRREVCLLPPLVDQSFLSQCNLESLYKVDHVVVSDPKPASHKWSSYPYSCKDLTPSTTCVMKKMNVLNKYNFMGYFQMKDRIRQFTSSQPVWSALLDIYMSAFVNIPMYGDHCSSQKKFLNVVDAMLMTCPVSEQVQSPQCEKIFKSITHTAPTQNQNITRKKLGKIMTHYHHLYLPNQPLPTHDPVIRKKGPRLVERPIYNFGFLDSKDSPKVSTINVKPESSTERKPLVLLPVYLRDLQLNKTKPFRADKWYRSNPYFLP